MYQPNYERIAERIVGQTIHLEKGEQVVMLVRQDTIIFAEVIAGEILRRGGYADLVLYSDMMGYHEVRESPLDYLDRSPEPFVAAFGAADVAIQVGVDFADPRTFHNVANDRLAAIYRRHQAIGNAMMSGKATFIPIMYPTPQAADSLGVAWNTLREMYWKAMDTDYSTLQARAEQIRERLATGHTIHIKSTNGTDLTMTQSTPFIVANGGSTERAGSLPAGEVYLIPDKESANGSFVCSASAYRGHKITELLFEFENGRGVPIRAREGYETFMDIWEQHDENRGLVAEVGIGINPEVWQVTGYYMDEMVYGAVHLGLGVNTHLGGDIESTLEWKMVLAKPTLLIDGEPLLVNGQFML